MAILGLPLFLKLLCLKDFKVIYEQHKAHLFLMARNHLPIPDAEDAVAHAFLVLWENKHSIPSHRIKPFLYRVVKNKVTDFYRKKNRETNKSDDLFYHLLLENDDILEIKSIVIDTLLKKAMKKLPPNPRNVFSLYLKGFNNIEVAQMLNLSVQTVKNQRHTALKIVREYMRPRLEPYIYIYDY